jgi:AraC-like DNA-binding protein
MRIARTTVHPPVPARGELRRYRGDHGAHVHAHSQVLFGLEGCLDVEVEGCSMLVDATAGLIVPSGAVHASSARFGAGVWVIDAPASREFDRVRPFALDAGRPDGVSVAQWLEWARFARRARPRRRLDTVSLEVALADALHEDWPAARMAAHFCLSVPQFHARWRGLTGLTPQAWLRLRRLNEAERLLRAGWSGDAVATHVGYARASALLYALRRERGIGVRDLRRA